jgi:hypothetical protein
MLGYTSFKGALAGWIGLILNKILELSEQEQCVMNHNYYPVVLLVEMKEGLCWNRVLVRDNVETRRSPACLMVVDNKKYKIYSEERN